MKSSGSGWVGFRLATRLARREIIRRPGRTLLVALLIALPVAGMTVAAVAVRTDHATPAQRWQAQHGQADAVAYAIRGVVAKIPGSRVVKGPAYVEGRVLRTTDSRRSVTTIETLDMTDPMTRGIVQVLSGRVPTKVDEVLLSQAAARELGVKAGDSLHLVRPVRHTLHVTGVGEHADYWGGAWLILPANVPYPWKPNEPPQPSSKLIDFNRRLTSADFAALASLTAPPASLEFSPAVDAPRITPAFDPSGSDAAQTVAWSWVIGALVLTVIGIVISAAFAVGARRQLVTLGQLAGNGAAPKDLRRVLFLQGTLTGLVGTALGLVLGAVALVVAAPYADEFFKRDIHPYTVRLLDVVPIVVLGVVTATIAALIPARAAGRVPVLAALAGRRPLGRVPRWIPVTGAFVATGGLALLGLAVLGAQGDNGQGTVWALTAIAGGVAVLLGSCAIAPAYVSLLEPAATRSRGSWRVATRSLARQRTRTSAVVSAIAATGALVIAASALVLATDHKNNASAQIGAVPANEVFLSGYAEGIGDSAPPSGFAAAVAKVLPHSTRFQLRAPYQPNARWGFIGYQVDDPTYPGVVELASGRQIFQDPAANLGSNFAVGIADPELIASYKLSAAHQRELARHGIIALARTQGHATLVIGKERANLPTPRPRRFDVTLVDGHRYTIGSLPSVLVTPAFVAQLGMTSKPSTVVVRAREALTTDQRNAIADVAADAQDAAPENARITYNYQYRYPETGLDPLLLEWLLVGVALVLTLFVVAVNLALSATETRDERDVLTIVGAAPETMSRTNGFKAALLTAMGLVLAIPVGLLPVAVFLKANKDGGPFVFPITVVALFVLALPLVAGLITTAASAIALRVRPVRISTMAFD
jgi:putative ABC transport system permease protein